LKKQKKKWKTEKKGEKKQRNRGHKNEEKCEKEKREREKREKKSEAAEKQREKKKRKRESSEAEGEKPAIATTTQGETSCKSVKWWEERKVKVRWGASHFSSLFSLSSLSAHFRGGYVE